MFDLQYNPVDNSTPDYGLVAQVPWDTETFGFGIGDYKTPDISGNLPDAGDTDKKLRSWARSHHAKLIGATIDASDKTILRFLQSAGFDYVDTTLKVRYQGIPDYDNAADELTLTTVPAEDIGEILNICSEAFESGRYHADIRFPQSAANRRYRDWAQRAYAPDNPQVVLAARFQGNICGISIVELRNTLGYLHLNAIASKWRGRGFGSFLIGSSVRFLVDHGASTVDSSISAANPAAMNLHRSLGAKFLDPRIVLHWHDPNSEVVIEDPLERSAS